jgi:hypothetical protein
MKLLIALFLPMAAAIAQNVPSPVQIENLTPALIVTFTRQQGNSYYFQVTNRSSHDVTAFSLRMVPNGIPKVDGRFECEDQCLRSVNLANTAKPAITAGQSVEWNFASSSGVTGATVVAEAAIFNDESFEGDERAAAFLLAGQIGRQAEYTRLINGVNAALTGGGDDDRRVAQVRMKLGSLSVNLDADMIRTFKLWFPELEDCIQPFAHFMKHAAAGEKRLVVESIERFAHDKAPGKQSFSQWWQTTQQQLLAYGCSGCEAQAMKPKPPPPGKNVFLGCTSNRLPVIYVASFDGNGLDLDGDESDAESELEPADVAAVKESHTRDARPVRPAPPSPVVKAKPPLPSVASVTEPLPPAKAEMPPELPTKLPAPRGPVGPSNGVPFGVGMEGQWFMRVTFAQPVPDYMIYRAFFREITTIGELALYEQPRSWWAGQPIEYHGPRAGGLSNAQVELLHKVATSCNRQVSLLSEKSESIIRAKTNGYPWAWIYIAPPIPEVLKLHDQEKTAMNKGIRQLRSGLGAPSFSRLDGFVHRVYQVPPGPVVTKPLSDEVVYARFFRYLLALHRLSPTNLDAKVEAGRRQQEMLSAGLGETEWTLLNRVVLDYGQADDQLRSQMPVFVPGSAVPAVANSVAAQPSNLVQSPTGSGPVPSNNTRPVDLQRALNEMNLNLTSHIAQLKTGMSETKLQSLNSYIRKLYAGADNDRIGIIAATDVISRIRETNH